MAKRGLIVDGIHFVSPPYTSERALMKVETLCEKADKLLRRYKILLCSVYGDTGSAEG